MDSNDIWSDVTAVYKNYDDYNTKLQVQLDNQPALDTGGVRRQMYTTVFRNFANDLTVCLFDGPPNNLRPICTPMARSSGLLKILGSMIAHSICQDGVGFPYLSLTCFWYIVGGEEVCQYSGFAW